MSLENFIKFGVTVFVLAAIVSVVFALAMTHGWIQAVFSFKNFGWLGVGIFYLKISVLIIILFFIYGLLLGPAPRILSALFAACVALLAVSVSLGFESKHNQLMLEKRLKEHEETCAEYPILCPEQIKGAK